MVLTYQKRVYASFDFTCNFFSRSCWLFGFVLYFFCVLFKSMRLQSNNQNIVTINKLLGFFFLHQNLYRLKKCKHKLSFYCVWLFGWFDLMCATFPWTANEWAATIISLGSTLQFKTTTTTVVIIERRAAYTTEYNNNHHAFDVCCVQCMHFYCSIKRRKRNWEFSSSNNIMF